MHTALLIEDDTVFRAYLRQILELSEFEVREAANGTEGLKAMKVSPSDLVVTDIIMAGGEGIETIMHMQKLYPRHPIIAISANEMYLEYATKLGASRTLLKPFGIAEFMSVVKELSGDTATEADDSPG